MDTFADSFLVQRRYALTHIRTRKCQDQQHNLFKREEKVHNT